MLVGVVSVTFTYLNLLLEAKTQGNFVFIAGNKFRRDGVENLKKS